MNETNILKRRNSTIELLRIISMVLIVISHYAVHGFDLNNINSTLNQVFIASIAFGEIGVVIYILISSYFMIESTLNFKKIIQIIFEVLFYSLLSLIIFICVNGFYNISLKIILKSIFPICFDTYWFISQYLILMIISPILNKLIKKINKNQLSLIITCLSFFTFFVPLILGGKFGLSNIFVFVNIYFIGSFLRLYINLDTSKRKNLVLFLSFLIILIFSASLLIILGKKLNNEFILANTRHFYSLNSILVLLCGFELFLYFLKINKSYNPIVNKIASTTLGIYLIHDNFLLRDIIWQKIFHTSSFANSNFLILHFLFTIISILIITCIIDLIRKITIEKVTNNFLNKYYNSIKSIILNIFDNMNNLLKKLL